MSQSGQFTTLSGAVSTLTGDSGGAVSPSIGNINIIGGTGIVVTGDDTIATLTLDMGANVATSFTTDAGAATPALNNLDVVGGANIATSGAGDTVTVAVSGTTDHAVQLGNASGSLTSIAVGTTGQVLVGATGADPAFSALGNNSGLTAHGVVVAEGNSAFVATAAGTNGMCLIAATGADPVFALLTSTGSTIAFTVGANSLNLETGAAIPVSFTTDSGSAVPAAGVLSVLGGSNINTSGATSVVTVNLDSAITLTSVATDIAAAGCTLSGTTLLADGTDVNISLTLTPKGSGEVIVSGAVANDIAFYSATSGLDGITLTDGQLVIGATAAAPIAGSITSTGSSLTVTGGTNTIDISIAAPVSVANGGTGATTLTDHAVLVGSGTAAITALTVGTIGQVLTGATTADPVFSAIGTNSSLTDHGVLLGQGTAAFVAASVGTDGQVFLGATGADPVFATLSSTGGTITFTPGAGTLNLESAGGGLAWSEITAATKAMVVGEGYILNYGTLLTATLPATAAVGDSMRLVGKGAGGWKLAQNAGQTVMIGTTATTPGVGGSLASAAIQDCIELLCITANTDFRVISSMGNITVV